MKKKVTLLCAVAAMGIAAAAGVSLQNRAQLSDVALANIEALASGEGVVQIPCLPMETWDCSFLMYDADGGMGICTIPDAMRVDLGMK